VNGLRPALEVHLLDFDGDLYGELLSVEFLHPLRSERKFESLDALQTQIQLDIAAAREWFASANL
jgi:riboflavin kinase/FMN adenylyltransferase